MSVYFTNLMSFPFVLGFLLIISCSSARKTGEQSLQRTTIDPSKTLGTVVKVDSCGFVLAVNESGESMYFLPLNLPVQYEKQGVKIQFTYVVSRAMQPSGCVVDRVVSIENIEAVNF